VSQYEKRGSSIGFGRKGTRGALKLWALGRSVGVSGRLENLPHRGRVHHSVGGVARPMRARSSRPDIHHYNWDDRMIARMSLLLITWQSVTRINVSSTLLQTPQQWGKDCPPATNRISPESVNLCVGVSVGEI